MPPTPTTTTRRWGRARGRDQGVPREAPQSDGQVNLQHSLQDFLSLVRREVYSRGSNPPLGVRPTNRSQRVRPLTPLVSSPQPRDLPLSSVATVPVSGTPPINSVAASHAYTVEPVTCLMFLLGVCSVRFVIR